MANIIIIDENWTDEILKMAEKFNNFAKKGSLRMLGFIIDKAFDLASDDNAESRYDAAKFLQRVRALNPKLISPYVSTLIDSREGRYYFESKEFVTPNYIESKEPVNKDSDEEDGVVVIEDETKEDAEADGGLLSWDIKKLIKYKIIKNLKKANYEEIASPIKKCACGDGKLERDDLIWTCSECETAYHENCAKIVAILEGYCRICDTPFTDDEIIPNDEPAIEDMTDKKDQDTDT